MMDPTQDDPIKESDGEGNRDPSLPEGMGLASYSPRADEVNPDNDQDNHVSPPDNDGETVPSDEVVDQVGG